MTMRSGDPRTIRQPIWPASRCASAPTSPVSLRLARAKVDRKFDAKIAQLATDLEQRARAAVRSDARSGARQA